MASSSYRRDLRGAGRPHTEALRAGQQLRLRMGAEPLTACGLGLYDAPVPHFEQAGNHVWGNASGVGPSPIIKIISIHGSAA